MSSDEDFQKMLSRLQANVASPKCGKLLYQNRLEFTPGGGVLQSVDYGATSNSGWPKVGLFAQARGVMFWCYEKSKV